MFISLKKNDQPCQVMSPYQKPANQTDGKGSLILPFERQLFEHYGLKTITRDSQEENECIVQIFWLKRVRKWKSKHILVIVIYYSLAILHHWRGSYRWQDHRGEIAVKTQTPVTTPAATMYHIHVPYTHTAQNNLCIYLPTCNITIKYFMHALLSGLN